jgi:hypothetical protein
MTSAEQRKVRPVGGDVYFFGGLALLALWTIYLVFGCFFWTGMGLRFDPPLPSEVYWSAFVRTSKDIFAIALTSYWFITYPILLAIAYGWRARRRQAAKDA